MLVLPKQTGQPTPGGTQAAAPTDGLGAADTQTALPTSPRATGEGVSVPPIEAELPGPGAAADIIGLVIRQGEVYTQAEQYRGPAAQALEPMLQTCLGRAEGGIDEWSGPEAYEQELASTMQGEVWTLEGYSPDFRLCVKTTISDAQGNPELWIRLVERLNGIELHNGADLFTDRLHVSGRVVRAACQLHGDWNEGVQTEYPLEDPALLEPFLSALEAGPFRDGWTAEGNLYSDDRAQAHLYLYLEDGTRVELRLLEGGLVLYQHLPWYYVAIPQESFEPLFRACLAP